MELAQELGLAGHVRNEVDGFIERIKSSPPPAVVKEVEAFWEGFG